MRARKHSSVITYSLAVISGVIGIGLCCFFGFGEVSSPTAYNYGFILLGLLMMLLVAFGYRGIAKKRRIGNEVWWQLLIVGLVWVLFMTLLSIFVFTCIALLSGGRAVF